MENEEWGDRVGRVLTRSEVGGEVLVMTGG